MAQARVTVDERIPVQILNKPADQRFFFEVPPLIIYGGWYQYHFSDDDTYHCTSPNPITQTGGLELSVYCHMVSWSSVLTRYSGPVVPNEVDLTSPWKLSYSGIYTGYKKYGNGAPDDKFIYFHHGENKNMVSYGYSYQNTVNTNVLVADCASGFNGQGVYSDCWNAYNGFIFQSWVPNADPDWGLVPVTDEGPVVWPEHGYINASGTKVSHGVRHPTVYVDADNIYLFYMDTGGAYIEAGCIKAARAARSSDGLPGSFSVLRNGDFTASALPTGFDKAQAQDFYDNKPAPSDCLLPTANPFSDRFAVAKVSGTDYYLGVEWSNDQKILSGGQWIDNPNFSSPVVLWLSKDLKEWRFFSEVDTPSYHNLSYPVFLNTLARNHFVIDATGFYLLGTNLDTFLSSHPHLYKISFTAPFADLAAEVFPPVYTLNYTTDGHGSITGSATQSIVQGTNGTSVTAVPSDGYYFTGWSDGLTANPRTDSSVSANLSVTANFHISQIPTLSAIVSTSDADSVEIQWQTDEAANSQVLYGLTSSTHNSTAVNNSLTLNHSQIIENLKSCATYYYVVRSRDEENILVSSSTRFFSTTGCPVSMISSGVSNTVETSTGGELQFNNNDSVVTLTLPTNFADTDADIQMNRLIVDDAVSLPTNKLLIDENIFDLKAVDSLNSELTGFNLATEFQVTYPASIEATYQESTLQVYKYILGTSSWESKNCLLDTASNTLTCSLSSFSVYAVLGELIPTPTPTLSLSSNTSSSFNAPSQNTSSPTNTTQAWTCQELPPSSTPNLFQLNGNGNSVTVYFTPIMGVSDYYLSYGETSAAEMHGILLNLSSSGVQSYTVGALKPYKTYYFKVRGQNGCMPGGWSNIKSIKTGKATKMAQAKINRVATPVKAKSSWVPQLFSSRTPSPQPATVNEKAAVNQMPPAASNPNQAPLPAKQPPVVKTASDANSSHNNESIFTKFETVLKSIVSFWKKES